MGINISTNTLINEVNDISSYFLIILKFCDWHDRFNCLFLNKFTFKITQSNQFYHWLCQRLSKENAIYTPKDIIIGLSWKEVFLSYYPIRNIWLDNGDDENKIVKKFKINVYAKFKPAEKLESLELTGEPNDDVTITLPLHQRLSIIKLSHQLTNNRQALKVLTNEGGWFAKKWENRMNKKQSSDCEYDLNIENYDSNKYDNLTTIVNAKKIDKMVAKVQTIDPGTGRVVVMAPEVGLREFSFDGVLGPSASQKSVYDITMKKLIVDLINGFNVTALVYGQTGSGKTYTMFGSEHLDMKQTKKYNIHSGIGLIPRTCVDIFNILNYRSLHNRISYSISISYVEIYGNNVYDLLKSGIPCGHSKVSSQRYVLQGAAERTITDVDDLFNALLEGDAIKRKASTAMNDRSTRAHSLVILNVTQIYLPTNVKRSSKLFLADLGGSEQVKKSQVDAGKSGTVNQAVGFELGDHMREAIYINLGLLSLKKCIDAINTKKQYVPYQDSKLTMLLSMGLGGNSRTIIIVCNRMEGIHINETMTTLRFGEQCNTIEKSSFLSSTMKLLNELNEKINLLESIIKKKEQWVNESVLIVDKVEDEEIVVESNQSVNQIALEKHSKVKLVGAEAERKLLEELLIQREQLTGVYVPSSSKVIGFGKEIAELYNIGSKYDVTDEISQENKRFTNKVDKNELPIHVKREWVVEETKDIELKAKAIQRNKLRYAGLAI